MFERALVATGGILVILAGALLIVVASDFDYESSADESAALTANPGVSLRNPASNFALPQPKSAKLLAPESVSKNKV